MDLNQIWSILIIIDSVALIVLVLIQQREGGGLGTLFGGGGGDSYRTRRGAEKFIFMLTISLAIIWVGLLVSKMFI